MNIRVMARAIAICLFACALFVPQAGAQTQTGTVEGKVVDQQGAVLPGVNVTLTGPRGSQTAVTDAQGMFRFVGVAPATYSLKAELTGFAVRIAVGRHRRTRQDGACRVHHEGERRVGVRRGHGCVDR